MRTALPLLLSLLFLNACGDENPDTDDPIDPTDGDLTETDTDGEEEEVEEPEPGPSDLRITASSYADVDLSAGDNKLQVLMGTSPIQLSYTVDPPDTEVTWSSSKARVASVSDNGELTFKSEGAVEITVSTGELTDSLIVEVADSVARSPFRLNAERHEGAGGEGGEGGGGVFLDRTYIRTAATLEADQPANEQEETPIPLTVTLKQCYGELWGGSFSPYYPGWQAFQISSNTTILGIDYCSLIAEVEGPYVLTKPMTVMAAEDTPLTQSNQADTAGLSEEDNLCALAIEGHNGFVWEGITLPDESFVGLNFGLSFAGSLSSNFGIETSILDRETGEIVASTSNLTSYADTYSTNRIAADIPISSDMQGKTVDIIVDITGRPAPQTAYGEDNFWVDDLEVSAIFVSQEIIPPPGGPFPFPPGSGPIGIPGDLIPFPIVSFQSLSTHSCDSMDDLKPLRMFEGRTQRLSAALSAIGSTTRRVFIPHDEQDLYVRNIDSYTNTSGQDASATVSYASYFSYGGAYEQSNSLVANGRAVLSLADASRYEHAAAVVAGDELDLTSGSLSATGNATLSLANGQTTSVMSFIPMAKYYGLSNAGPNETYLTPFIEDIVSSFASDPLDSKYAVGISTDLWDQMLGWSNPDPLTPVPGDSADADTGGL